MGVTRKQLGLKSLVTACVNHWHHKPRPLQSFPVEHEIPPALPAFSLHQLSFIPPIQTGLPLEIHKLEDLYPERDSKRCLYRKTPICLRFFDIQKPRRSNGGTSFQLITTTRSSACRYSEWMNDQFEPYFKTKHADCWSKEAQKKIYNSEDVFGSLSQSTRILTENRRRSDRVIGWLTLPVRSQTSV